MTTSQYHIIITQFLHYMTENFHIDVRNGKIESVGYVGTKKCDSEKCPFGELAVRGNVTRGTVRQGNARSEDCPFGELSFGEMSVGGLSVGEMSLR